MSKTSISDWTKGIIILGAIMSTIVFAYILADVNYDIEDIDTSGLVELADYDAILESVNGSSSSAYDDVTTDRSLFDVLGGLVVDAITAVRVFIDGLAFLSDSTRAMLGSSLFLIPFTVVSAVIAIIMVTLSAYFLFEIVAGRKDEK